jgi:hypothetical protein
MSTSETHDLLRQGITAAKQGDKTRAREILLRVIELDEKSEPAWLWLSGVVVDIEDQIVCLENVLTINPDNSAAARGLRLLQSRLPPSPPPEPEPPPPPPDWAYVAEDREPLSERPAEPPPEEPIPAWAEEAERDYGPAPEEPQPSVEVQTRVCPHCGKTNPVWRTHCGVCRRPIDAEIEPAEPVSTPLDAIPAEADADVITCVHCGKTNPGWRATCSMCLKPLRDEPELRQPITSPPPPIISQPVSPPEEVQFVQELDTRPQGLLTLVAAWIAAIAFNRRGAYEYEIFSASVGRTVIGVVIGGVAVPLLGGLLIALFAAAANIDSMLALAASLGENVALLAVGGAAGAVGVILSFYLWVTGLYLIAWLLGGKASFLVHTQLLSVAYAASSLLTFTLMIVSGALWAFLVESSPTAGIAGALGLALLGIIGVVYTVAMNGQAVSVAHRFSWVGGVGTVLLTALIFGLVSAILIMGLLAVSGVSLTEVSDFLRELPDVFTLAPVP